MLSLLDTVQGTFDNGAGLGPLSGLYTLVSMVPSFTVTVRRLHDLDISGWGVLIGLVPIFNIILLFYLAFVDGTPGPNRFGPDPKGRVKFSPPATVSHEESDGQKENYPQYPMEYRTSTPSESWNDGWLWAVVGVIVVFVFLAAMVQAAP